MGIGDLIDGIEAMLTMSGLGKIQTSINAANYAVPLVGAANNNPGKPKGYMELPDFSKVLGGSGTNLQSGDDLNNKRTLGWYFSGGGTQGSAITPTLINCPVTGGSFSMLVIKCANNNAYLMQVLFSIHDSQGGIYTRVVDSSGTEYKPWYKYSMNEI